MKGNRIVRKLKFIPLILVGIAVFGAGVMALWNWLMPAIFGLHTITFWQAMGVLLLSKILFGGFRGGPGAHTHWRHRMMERWVEMTPEERAKFLEGLRGGCGPFGAPMPESPKA